ncbi:MAG: hypothetical protein A2Z38_09810 [Planctomycetes bacterium RBG_19FT_COMBO_48_8]|nr:MAG: hypothetical protein A2Z38_09810 [Planctomycetes bacterium RBG_19FT_COMBO_48_8]
MFALFHQYATALNTIANRPAVQGGPFEKKDNAGFAENCWKSPGAGVTITGGYRTLGWRQTFEHDGYWKIK